MKKHVPPPPNILNHVSLNPLTRAIGGYGGGGGGGGVCVCGGGGGAESGRTDFIIVIVKTL